MARYAMIHEASGFVVNVIEWDGKTETWQPPEGHVMVEDAESKVAVGSLYTEGEFRAPPSGQPGTATPLPAEGE